jgi:hypothetical protein
VPFSPRDPGWVKSQDPDPGIPGSGINNLYRIFESLETIFWVKILKFFYSDPGWKKFGSGMETIRIRDKHPRSATLVGTIVTDTE